MKAISFDSEGSKIVMLSNLNSITESGALHPMDHHLVLDNRLEPTLVVYGRDRCGACRHLERLLKEDNWLAELFPGLIALSVDLEQGAWLAEELSIFHLPALFLYRDGDILCEIKSQLTRPALETSIQKALSQESI